MMKREKGKDSTINKNKLLTIVNSKSQKLYKVSLVQHTVSYTFKLLMSKLNQVPKYWTKMFSKSNWNTLNFENKSKYKNKFKDKLTCGSFQVSLMCWSSSWHLSILTERILVHINGDVTWGTFLFICHEKGWAKAGNRRGLWLVSFGQLQGIDGQHSCHQDVW